MAQINRPGQTMAGQKGQDNRLGGTGMGMLSGAGTGAAIGSAVPGLGTLVGAGVGAALGGGASYANEAAKVTEDTPAQQEAPADVPQQGGDGAMQRRLDQLETTSKLQKLHESAQALPGLTPEQRAQYAEPFMRGYMGEIDKAISKGYLKPGGVA